MQKKLQNLEKEKFEKRKIANNEKIKNFAKISDEKNHYFNFLLFLCLDSL